MAVVHSTLPDSLTAVVDEVLRGAGVEHRAHGPGAPWRAPGPRAEDRGAVALIGPLRSADVADVVEATAPAGLPLIAPVATWAGATRAHEPGCDAAADHRGTVLRMVARDTEVAARIARWVRGEGRRAFVVAGAHEDGGQLDGRLRVGGPPRPGGVWRSCRAPSGPARPTSSSSAASRGPRRSSTPPSSRRCRSSPSTAS